MIVWSRGSPPLAAISPSWAALRPGDPLTGYVNCDDLGPLYRDQIVADLGALSMPTMVDVGRALQRALAL